LSNFSAAILDFLSLLLVVLVVRRSARELLTAFDFDFDLLGLSLPSRFGEIREAAPSEQGAKGLLVARILVCTLVDAHLVSAPISP